MRFFVPGAPDGVHEAAYRDIVRAGERDTGRPILDRRISSISYRADGRSYTCTVGEMDDRAGGRVLAILEGEATYLVYTPARLNDRQPMWVGKEASPVDFER